MNRHEFSLAMFAAMLLAASTESRAATILTSPAEFSTPTVLISFEQFPNGEQVPIGPTDLVDQWRPWGMVLEDSSPFNGARVFTNTFDVLPHSPIRAIADSEGDTAGGFIIFSFVIPGTSTPGTVQEAGLWVQNGDVSPSTVSFFDVQGGVLQTLTTSLSDQFIGIRATEGIASIRVSDDGFDMVDDLQFTPVPEPWATEMSLMALALQAHLGRRRRHPTS